jgi:hypothetical protein
MEIKDFDFEKYRTGITYHVGTSSRDEAKKIMDEYFND